MLLVSAGDCSLTRNIPCSAGETSGKMPWQVVWSLSELLHVFTSASDSFWCAREVSSPSGLLMGFLPRKRRAAPCSAWSPSRHTKTIPTSSAVPQYRQSYTHWSYVFRLRCWVWPPECTWVTPGLVPQWVLPSEPQTSTRCDNTTQTSPTSCPSTKILISPPLRKNLLSPELIQHTSPSRPPQVFAWVRSWGTEWKAHTPKPALPPELLTSDWERPKVLFLEMGNLFGNGKKPWKF